MSGGVEFDARKFEAVADYYKSRSPKLCAADLAFLMMSTDFTAYRHLGHSITGATYLRGAHTPEIAELDPLWFRRFIRARTPLWARLLAWPIVLAVVLQGLRRT